MNNISQSVQKLKFMQQGDEVKQEQYTNWSVQYNLPQTPYQQLMANRVRSNQMTNQDDQQIQKF
ncbi:hypothetical protein pb186bvf_001709 [Paramecium bursaria]